MTSLLVIANGRLRKGLEGARWRRLSRSLLGVFGKDVEVRFTEGAGDATRKTRQALRDGHTWIAAAGGDGTFNEAANGFFECGTAVRPDASLSFLPCGSGNDWVRTLGISADRLDTVEALLHSKIQNVDIGLAHYRNLLGAQESRVFINVAEAGVGGSFLARRQGRGFSLGRWFGYRLESLAEAITFSPVEIGLSLNGSIPALGDRLLSLIVANGRYFGAGMHCAPMARPDDGLFDVITVGDFRAFEILRKIRKFFSGDYLDERKVSHRPARTVGAVSDERVFLELDGELVGMLPAQFEIRPGALRIRT